MYKTIVSLIITISISLFLSGCASSFNGNKPIVINKNKTNKKVYTKDEDQLFKKLELITKKQQSIDNVVIEKEMRINPVLSKKYEKEALIITKKPDEITKKPLYLEPIFAKVEVMPYVSKNGLYHSQQTIWVKVKEGDIVIKSNDFMPTSVDSFKSILMK